MSLQPFEREEQGPVPSELLGAVLAPGEMAANGQADIAVTAVGRHHLLNLCTLHRSSPVKTKSLSFLRARWTRTFAAVSEIPSCLAISSMLIPYTSRSTT